MANGAVTSAAPHSCLAAAKVVQQYRLDGTIFEGLNPPAVGIGKGGHALTRKLTTLLTVMPVGSLCPPKFSLQKTHSRREFAPY